jgi:hypothetical protein
MMAALVNGVAAPVKTSVSVCLSVCQNGVGDDGSIGEQGGGFVKTSVSVCLSVCLQIGIGDDGSIGEQGDGFVKTSVSVCLSADWHRR